jgi:hypothetical protein
MGRLNSLNSHPGCRIIVTGSATIRFTTVAAPGAMPPVIWLSITIILTIVDAFGVSTAFGFVPALAFWGALVGVNMLSWSAWRRSVPGRRDSAGRVALGALVLNLLLSIEVPLLYRLMGQGDATVDWKPFAYGLLVTSFVTVLLRATRVRHTPAGQDDDVADTAGSPAIPTTSFGILARAGIDPADLVSVRAEDHYCRLAVRGGGTLLVHYRFRDAVGDLADVQGAQVHRGAWVADFAVTGSERTGRRWSLHLADGSRVPVSETSVALCRARGWLERGELA